MKYQDNWISVKEKPVQAPCLIVYKNRFFDEKPMVSCTDAFKTYGDDYVIDEGEYGRIHEVVFWMPYPKLPRNCKKA